MKNSKNVSNFIINNNFFSFIENAVVNCDFYDFPTLLEDYLSIANKYQISLKYLNIKPVIELVTTENSISTYKNINQLKNQPGATLTPSLNNFEKNYIWPNGLVFLNKLFQDNPDHLQQFIQDDFLKNISKIILNYNAYLLNNCSDQKEFHSFFELTLNSLNKTLFNDFYSKNNLYIERKTSPHLRSLIDKISLEINLNNKNHSKTLKI